VMGFHPVSKRMQVETLHPGVTRDQVTANTGFALLWSGDLGETPEPTDDELRILRDEVDPAGFVIGRR
jgi:acyl CoA:acetate/3-ketoacid CoA transferase beta subunit